MGTGDVLLDVELVGGAEFLVAIRILLRHAEVVPHLMGWKSLFAWSQRIAVWAL
jgi:hypothetical protein